MQQANLRQVDVAEWAHLRAYIAATTGENSGAIVDVHIDLTRLDLHSLEDGEQLKKDEAVREMALRFVKTKPRIAFFNSFAMEKMMPLSAASSVFGNAGRPLSLSTRTWATVVGRDRKIGRDVKFVFAVHYVPGHWCFILADFEKQLITYYGSYCGAVYATDASRVFKTWLASECVRQNSDDYRPACWRVAVNHAPKQPDGVSCGVCVKFSSC